MAIRAYTVLKDNVNLKIIKWTGLLQSDTGQPYEFSAKYPDKCVQVFGTFGATPHCFIEGTNELVDGSPANYITLNTPASAALDLTAAGLKQVLENTNLIRPRCTGDGTLSLTVLLCIGK